MPTWDEITPDLERTTRSFKMTGTNVLIGINILGFILSGILPSVFGVEFQKYVAFEAHHAIGKLWVWQFVTYSFVQHVDIWFMIWFVFNAYVLYLFGNDLEQELGLRRFLTLYFSFAAYGALAHGAYQYISGSVVPTISLFGPVFGIVVAYALRYPSRPILFFFVIPMKLMTAVLISGAILVFYCVISFNSGLSPASILGAAIAAFAMHKIGPWLERRLDDRQVHREQDRTLEAIELRREVDRILEKISTEGMGALTRIERKTLKRASDAMGRQPGHPD